MNITGFTIKVIDTHENDRVLNEERTEAGKPVLAWSGADDKYLPLMTSEFNFNFSVPGAADGAFYHLYTGNDTRYRVELADQDNVLLWAGFLMPDQYSEPYKGGHLFVDVTATDGIGRLKGKYLPYDYYNKESSVIKLIAECLQLTGLSQNIVFAAAVLPAANNYRWDEIFVDGTNYRDEVKGVSYFDGPPKLPKRKNAYEILELLVKNIGCTLFTFKGQWYLIGINRKHEEYGTVLNYSANGAYLGTGMLYRETVLTVFEATPPQVTIMSPWRNVTITWGIDEDGNLLPENVFAESPDKWNILTNPFVESLGHGLPNEAPLMHWQKNGTIACGVASRDGKYVVDYTSLGTIAFPVYLGPWNLSVGQTYTHGVYGSPGYYTTAEYYNGTNINWIKLLKPKYIAKSDAYLQRSLTFKISLFGNGGSQELIDTEVLQDMFFCELRCGGVIVASNRKDMPGYNNFKFELAFRGGSESTAPTSPTGGTTATVTLLQTTGDLEKEGLTVQNNGFMQIYLFAPVSPDPEHPLFYGYTVTDLKLEYTPMDEWHDELERNIDNTEVYDLDIEHGDSVQDLSKKQFRFRRAIYSNLPTGSVAILQRVVAVPYFRLSVSYQDAQLIMQNPGWVSVTYDGVDYNINELYGYSGAYGTNWLVSAYSTGVYYVQLVVIPHPSGIFDDINNFEAFKYVSPDDLGGVVGYVTENNEWRESWKRFGYSESLRYGLALGRIYHDVQAEPLVKLEGTAFGLFGPLERFFFHWMEDKRFVPIRLSLDLTKNKTGVTLLESKITNVNDYI